ncbi:putative disease resistance RPP13-like protein 1 [Pistacia vera]|uniref:putative disease resistance RPP13-like protein 1 n=1 Tax=Pistacia vera TaxID=55513 RepID=UPI0012638B26|nr:putative disease resistance RPP13-like protein 1 [Pistacia vera]
MAIGELFLSAFIKVLFERLASRELLNFASQEGVGSKLKIWEERLVMIQARGIRFWAVLRDAKEKQLTDRAVKLWLDNLQDLAYDIDDIVDEFATEALRRELMAKNQPGTSKVRNLIPSFFTGLRFNRSLDSRIKIFTNRLEELCKQRNELGLLPIPGRPSSAAAQQRPLSTSVPTEPVVYGRDEDKARILGMLLGDEPSYANFCVIPIVGMAGVGKTTLAWIVYNDEAVEAVKPRSWVCVSDDFDVFRISKALLESIMSLPCSLNDLNDVQVQLKNALDGKKFLLVLDDVWNKNYGLWQLLMSPFMSGAPGSKIIVRTRNTDVALTVGSVKCYELKGISNKDCWSVFVKHAFQRREIDVHDMPKLIRKKVVEKCRGLPLAARTLGSLLRSKQRYDTWEDILNSNIWDLLEESGILPLLRLSYHHLPSYLKRCFIYYVIFPKDYEFEEKELVLLWMAERVIQQVASSNRQMEDLGSQYFHDLLSRSIFQQSSNNSSKFVMHDLIHDMAQLVSGETIFRLEESRNHSKGFKRARHSSYRCGFYDGKNKFEVFHEFECLRTFLPLLMNGYILSDRPLHITNTVIIELLPKFKKLRVLSLRGYYITQLPNSIGGLRHLRLENVTNSLEIGEAVLSDKKDLEALSLLWRSHEFDKPQDEKFFGSRICKNGNIGSPFKEMRMLNDCRLRELYVLKCPKLCGKLRDHLPSLKTLVISECAELEVSLSSFPILDKLEIDECKGALKSLREGIKHKNAHLERLQIKGCHSLTFIGGDQLPSSLIEVDISNCGKLQCLFHDEEYVCNSSLPPSSAMTHKENVCKTSLLMFLSISNCPSLMCISLSGQLPLALKYLQVRGCSEIATLSSRSWLPEKLESLKIDGLHNLSRLQRIEIQNCPSLVSFPEGGLPNTKLIVAIDSCEKLEALPNHLYSLNSLQVLKIKQCPSIQFFPEEGFPTNLTTLSIKDLKIYKALIEWGLHKLTSLKHLHIAGCYAMFSLKRRWE